MRGLSIFLSLALPLFASASATPHNGRRHPARHVPHSIELQSTEVSQNHTFEKRFSGSKWSFYDVGLGACGKSNGPRDFIVALNAAQFGDGYPGPHCFQTITMSYNGKTTQATIMDRCPGCPYGGLDLSRGLFDFFADQSLGIIHGSWEFGGGGPKPPPPPPPPPPPSPTPPPPPPSPTSTRARPTTTSTSTFSTSTSIEISLSAEISIAASTSSSTTSSSTAIASQTPPANSFNGNLNDLNNILLSLGQIVIAGAAT